LIEFDNEVKKSVDKILKAPDFHDLDNLGDPEKDVAISCSSRFVARLYDQKKYKNKYREQSHLYQRF
jgi:hypothetical protein